MKKTKVIKKRNTPCTTFGRGIGGAFSEKVQAKG